MKKEVVIFINLRWLLAHFQLDSERGSSNISSSGSKAAKEKRKSQEPGARRGRTRGPNHRREMDTELGKL